MNVEHWTPNVVSVDRRESGKKNPKDGENERTW